MYTLHLSDTELETARHALRAYLSDFGHDEADTIAAIRRVIAKLESAQTDGQDPRISA
jgi:alcohol dehydrogenase class IV